MSDPACVKGSLAPFGTHLPGTRAHDGAEVIKWPHGERLLVVLLTQNNLLLCQHIDSSLTLE